jgi:hypothetical protein
MKYIKQYETAVNTEYKKYVITQVKSDKFSDIYTNLYENLFYTKNINSFICRYYLEQDTNIIQKFNTTNELNYLNTDSIIYQTDELSDALEFLKVKVKSDKYNL